MLHRFYDNPTTSVRTVAAQEGVSRSSVHRIAQADGLYPFHRQKVQKLLPADPGHRMGFAQFVLDRIEIEPDFPYVLLQTDEAKLDQTGIYNLHNIHNWQHENPHRYVTRAHQERFSVNLWVGMVGDCVVGPYFLPARLTGQNYLVFLQEVLPELLEHHVPEDVRNRIFFQHDGAPPHFARAVRDHLTQQFPGRWIGRGGPVPWPPRSPDFSRPDFCYWGWLNQLVCDGTEIASQEDLVARIAAAAGEIRDRPETLRRSCDEFVHRCRMALRPDVQGRHFENLL